MRKRIRLRHAAQLRASDVCTRNSAQLDATAGGQKLRLTLGGHVADVTGHLALQETSIEERRAATAVASSARRRLCQAAKAIVAVGKLVTIDDAVTSTMRLPGPVSDDHLLAHGRALIEIVAPHADIFVAEGLPRDLLENLGEAIEQLEAARDAQSRARLRFTGLTVSIRENQSAASRTIAAIEAIAPNMPDANPEMLTELRIAKRIGPRLIREPRVHVESVPEATTMMKSTDIGPGR